MRAFLANATREMRAAAAAAADDDDYYALAQPTATALAKGLYALQLRPWLEALGRGRVKVLRADALFAAPERALNDVLRWLGLAPFERGALAARGDGALFTRARGSGGRAAEVADGDDGCHARARALFLRDEDVNALRAWYAPHNAELARLLALHGVPFEPWAELPDNTARRRRRRR